MSMKSQPTTEMLKPCVFSVQVTLTRTQDFLHPFFCTWFHKFHGRVCSLHWCWSDRPVCAEVGGAWWLGLETWSWTLSGFFWWRHRGCCPGRQVPILLCFTQTRNFMTFEVPRCKVGWKRWRANLSLAACPMLSMCLHYSRLDCYMWPPCVTVWSGPNCPPPPGMSLSPFAASLVHAGVKFQNQPEIAYRSLFKGHTGKLPKKGK